ncbi:serine/threonine-protein kinase ULK3-like [Stegodyphus dumicola]|uniref:serine/threonine-protein kinase ULK3-like n=1 Tax=Stegodyphus dumicola TaxID=202533 RepID=UPI0015A8A71A|nr:serine/threonine-protein kinase ULK3-like [Stegodyphus dumicola]
MDLKPQNILLSSTSNPVLKLGDFGLAQYLHSDAEGTSFRGSPLYMAPEILLKHHYDARVDLWSVGIILYECLFGHAPFSSRTFTELAEKIKSSNPIEIPYGAEISEKCRELIIGLLQRDPNKRLSFEEFFNHPFVDLEHMPTAETYTKGVNLVQQAVEADAAGKFDKAIKFYSEALEYLVPHVYSEKDREKKRALRTKLLEYVSRAEELKNLIKKDSKDQDSSTHQLSSNLGDIITINPELEKGFFLVQQAETLVQDGCYDDAVHLYQSALEILVPAVSKQQPGPRKDILYAEVNKWLKKAEDLKSFISILKQQRKIARLNSTIESVHFNSATENIDSTCSLQ